MIRNPPWTALLTLALLHALVDAFALFVQPLWPDLQRGFGRRPEDVQWAYVSWSLATSFSQLAFGYIGDRWHSKWLLWLGPALGMACVCSIGLLDNFFVLNSVLFLGGLGVAAFHPEAAAAAGSCLPANRSRAMSIFAVGGYFGQAAGPLYSGVVTTHFGLAGLSWSLLWGAAALAMLMIVLRRAPIVEEAAALWPVSDRATLPDRRSPGEPADGRPSVQGLGGVGRPAPSVGRPAPSGGVKRPAPSSRGRVILARRGVLALLLVTCTLRVLPMLGVPLALAFAIKLDGGTNAHVGAVQSAFLLGIGIGSLACAWLVRPINERRAMWLLPLIAVPLLVICPLLSGGWLLAAVCAAGVVLGGAMPVLIGYGQQLLPQAQRVASSLTMGVTWGLGGLIVAGVMAHMNERGSPQEAIYLFAACAALSSFTSVYLPRVSGPQTLA